MTAAESKNLKNRKISRRAIEYSGAVTPLMAALSAVEVGTRSRSRGTMVMWPPCTMGICARSNQRRRNQKPCSRFGEPTSILASHVRLRN